jgi:hypothetical protein
VRPAGDHAERPRTSSTGAVTTEGPTTTEAPVTTATPPTTAGTPLPEIIPGVRTVLFDGDGLGFTLRYPENATILKSGFTQYLPLTENSEVAFALPKDMFAGTNLLEAGVYIGGKVTVDLPAHWSTAYGSGEVAAGETNINGFSWYVFDGSEGAAGSIYETRVYRTANNGTGYEMVELLHYAEIGNYTPGTVEEFDKAKFQGYLEAIARSFTFAE